LIAFIKVTIWTKSITSSHPLFNVSTHWFHLLTSLIVPISSQTDQKLRLCDICGAFLSVYDRLSSLLKLSALLFPFWIEREKR